MVSSDLKEQPFKSVILEDTEPNYNMYSNYSVFTADTNQSAITPGLLVHITASASANAVTLATAAFGSTVKTNSQIGIVEIPRSHPSFPKTYEKDIAFTAATDTFKVHWLRIGDKIWVKSASISATCNEVLICAADGLVAKAAGTTTIDGYNVHAFRPLRSTSSKTWTQVEYLGRISIDNSP